MSVDPAAIASGVASVRERIERAASRAGRRAEEIRLIAVTKTFGADSLRAAYAAGVRDFGENRVQEWAEKHAEVVGLTGAVWHMIGRLQRNKARRALELFHRIDSVDSLDLARRLDGLAAETGRVAAVLLEVRLSPEEAKTGIEPIELERVAEEVAALKRLEFLGLMTVPPWSEEAEPARPYFQRLRQLREQVGARLGRNLPVLSMGMSHDFEVAIEEGATEVRVGTAIFGRRGKPAATLGE